MGTRTMFAAGILTLMAVTTTACGGGGSGGGGSLGSPAPVTVAPTSAPGQLLVTWNSVAGATLYRVYFSLTPGIATHADAVPGEITVRGVLTTSVVLPRLYDGGPYYVAVRAGNDAGDGPFSPELTGMPLPMPPDSFVAFGGSGVVTTSWAPVPGAVSYEVFLAADPSVSSANWGSLPEGREGATAATTFTFDGLANGTPYWGVVRAVNASGFSADSASRSAKPTARGTFLPGSAIAVGDSPQGSVTALLDGDAFLDIAVVDEDADTVSVFFGVGDGTFAFDAAYPTGGSPVAVMTVDLDGDGGLELLTANQDGTVSVLDGDGAGGFADRVDWYVGGTPASLCVGQLDPSFDGTVDVVVTDTTNAQVAVLYGVGDESFWNFLTFPCGAMPVYCHIADVNGDGLSDVLTANTPAGTVSALLGDGWGDFSARFDSAAGIDCSSLDVGEFDGDGIVDVVVTSALMSSVTFLHGQGDGTFTPFAPVLAGSLAAAVVAGDFDGDGIEDVVVINKGDGSVAMLRGDGAGNFTPFSDILAGTGASAVSVGDFNGDGILDIAVTTTGTGEVTILLGSP